VNLFSQQDAPLPEANKVLQGASEAVQSARREAYGPVLTHFEDVATMWNQFLGLQGEFDIKASDVPLMMVLYKVCREKAHHSLDNMVDIAGYAAVCEQVISDQGGPG